MRRASLTPMMSLGGQEPLIVVEESGCLEEDEPSRDECTPRRSLDIDSPQNPYLLSPWRDPRETRKHSLPTPACTSGITASQVRRLSERGGEGSGPSPREAAFLATLSTAPAPQPGGRRHSVVTISRVPPALFGRGRRESVAALPAGARGPPATDRRGSSHNLQLDIMDDIVTARKVRMKLWNTSSERVCEVQPLEEGEGRAPQRYTHGARRFSDFSGCNPLAPPPIPPTRRRASELPPSLRQRPPPQGIVCSDTDLVSILSTLTSSATEIDRCVEKPVEPVAPAKATPEARRGKLKSGRSNSFDVSVLHGVEQPESADGEEAAVSPSSWFIKRHQTLAAKKESAVAAAEETRRPAPPLARAQTPPEKLPKVVWDNPTGSIVDAQVLGSAIEVFLRQTGGTEAPPTTQPPVPGRGPRPPPPVPGQSARPPPPPRSRPPAPPAPAAPPAQGQTWDEESAETCDTSLCSTLKDLFVK